MLLIKFQVFEGDMTEAFLLGKERLETLFNKMGILTSDIPKLKNQISKSLQDGNVDVRIYFAINDEYTWL